LITAQQHIPLILAPDSLRNTIAFALLENHSLASLATATSRQFSMGDFGNYGGSDEENAAIKQLNAEVVST